MGLKQENYHKNNPLKGFTLFFLNYFNLIILIIISLLNYYDRVRMRIFIIKYLETILFNLLAFINIINFKPRNINNLPIDYSKFIDLIKKSHYKLNYFN